VVLEGARVAKLLTPRAVGLGITMLANVGLAGIVLGLRVTLALSTMIMPLSAVAVVAKVGVRGVWLPAGVGLKVMEGVRLGPGSKVDVGIGLAVAGRGVACDSGKAGLGLATSSTSSPGVSEGSNWVSVSG
jgi:hypothetical protein